MTTDAFKIDVLSKDLRQSMAENAVLTQMLWNRGCTVPNNSGMALMTRMEKLEGLLKAARSLRAENGDGPASEIERSFFEAVDSFSSDGFFNTYRR